MLNPSPEWQTILPYPSRASLAELLVAMIEGSSGIALPEDWPINEPHYLNKGVVLDNLVLRETIDDVVGQAEPGGRLFQELEHFERMMAEDTLKLLESTANGRIMLDAVRAAAMREQKRRESGSNGAE